LPELPEIETIVNDFKPLIGRRLIRKEILRNDMIKIAEYEQDKLNDALIEDIYRRGKFLVFVLGEQLSGQALTIIFHLGMSGRLYWQSEESEFDRHVHFIAWLDNGCYIVYRDPRRFGGIRLVTDREGFFASLGMEPLSPEFDSEYLRSIIDKRRAPIKNLLMDQHLIVGIGNIYADEALFAAGIKPHRPAESLTATEAEHLTKAIKEALLSGIEHRGTTFRDYRDGENKMGENQKHLHVYGRRNQPCVKCGQLLIYKKIGGRGTHYCDNCQA
jgi:formamidopyrimidine-DNA glycosylase